MRAAYVYVDQTADLPIIESFYLMILLDELKKRMGEDIVNFSYKEKDGTVHQAYGTRCSEVIVRHEGAVFPPEEKRLKPSNGTFPYYDIESKSWNSFVVDSLQDINRGYTI